MARLLKSIFSFLISVLIFSHGLYAQSNPVHLSRVTQGLKAPTQIAVDNDGIIYVSDLGQKNISKYDTSGTLIGTLTYGTLPLSITFDSQNRMFIGDEFEENILRVDTDGTQTVIYDEISPSSMVVGADNLLYVSDKLTKLVVVMDLSGNFIRTIGAGFIVYPSGITYSEKYNWIYVAEHGGLGGSFSSVMKIRIFDLLGNHIISFANNGNTPGRFYRIGGITSDKCGNIYATDPYLGRISIFSFSGVFLGWISEFGDSLHQLKVPQDIKFDSKGDLIITSMDNGSLDFYSIDVTSATSNLAIDDMAICPGDTIDIPVEFTGTAPWTFSYTIDAVDTFTVTNTTDNPYIISTVDTGLYEVITLSDSGSAGTCFAGTPHLTAKPFPTSTITSGNDTICPGATAGIAVDFTGTAPWTFTYTIDDSNPTIINNTGDDPYLLNVADSGTYKVTAISDGACVGTAGSDSAQITVNGLPSSTITSADTSIVIGDSTDIIIEFTGTAPWTFIYTIDGANPDTIVNTSDNPYTLTVADSGLYQVTGLTDVSTTGTCFLGSTNVSVEMYPTSNITSGTVTHCPEDITGYVTVEFTGTAPWTFIYTVNSLNPDTISNVVDNPYTFYTWNAAGTYEITALSDAYATGTIFTGVGIIMEDTLPSAIITSGVSKFCPGDSVDLSVAFTGTSPWTFTYTIDQLSPTTITNTTANPYILRTSKPGMYEVTAISDLNNSGTCFSSDSVSIIHNEVPIVDIPTGAAIICGAEGFDIPVNFTGSNPWSITYTVDSINPVTVNNILQSPYTINATTPGLYEVTAMSDANCPSTNITGLADLSYQPKPTAYLVPGNSSHCVGTYSPLTVKLSGTAPWSITYQIDTLLTSTLNNVSLNPLIINSAHAGTYEVIAVSDAYCDGIVISTSVVLGVDSFPTAGIIGGDAIICSGEPTNIPVDLTGESPWSITYTVDSLNPVTVSNITDSSYLLTVTNGGTYALSVVSDANCTGTDVSGNAVIGAKVLPTSNITYGYTILCTGDSTDISIDLTGAAPWSLTYTVDFLNPSVISGVAASPYILNTSQAGTYEIIAVSDTNCTATSMSGIADIFVNPVVSSDIVSGSTSICPGVSTDIAIELTGTAPWTLTYTITGPSPTTATVSNITASPYMLSVSQPGTYIVTALSDANCAGTSFTDSAIITGNPLPTSDITSGNTTICTGDSTDISIDFTGTSPWTFTYTVDGLFPTVVSSVASSPYIMTVSQEGLYQVTAISDAICSGTSFTGSANITVNGKPTASISSTNSTICVGDSTDVTFDLTGTSPWTFTYTIDSLSPTTISSTSSDPYILDVSQAGKYEVIALSDAACTGTSFSGNVDITVNSLPTADITSGNATICSGDSTDISIDLTGTGPWSFTYTLDSINPTVISSVSSNPYLLSATQNGLYEVTTVSDANCAGSSFTGSADITVNAKPTATVSSSNSTICTGDSTDVIIDLTGTSPWTFTYTIDSLSPNTISNTSSDPHILNVLQAGRYELTVLSDAVCTGTSFGGSVDITVNPLPTSDITSGNATICSGDSSVISIDLIGTAPWAFTYTLDSLNPTVVASTSSSPYILTATQNGLYEIIAVSDANCTGTSFTGSANITVNPLPTSDITSGNTAICAGDSTSISVDLVGTAPWSFTYTLDSLTPTIIASTSSSPYLLTITQNGLYEIIAVSDANCSGTSNTGSAEITVNALPASDITSGNASICAGDSTDISIDLMGTGPWSITYTIDSLNPSVVSSVLSSPYLLSASQAGLYVITEVSDANCVGTSFTGTSIISVGALPTSDITSGDAQICLGSTSNISVDLTGSAPWTLTYTIDSLNPTIISGLTNSPYTLTVSEAGLYEVSALSDAACTGSAFTGSSVITVNPLPTSDISSGNATICNGESTDITFDLSGTPPWAFTYTLDNLNPTLVNTSGTPYFLVASQPGTYEVISVSDTNCIGTDYGTNAFITVTPELAPSFAFNDNDLEVSFLNNSLNANSYLWDFGDFATATDINPVHTYATAGTYFVYLTASNGICADSTISASVTVTHVGIEGIGFGGTLEVYPNPTSGKVTLEFNNLSGSPVQVEITSFTGQAIYKHEFKAPYLSAGGQNVTEQIDMSSYASGIYTVRLSSKEHSKTVKLVLMK